MTESTLLVTIVSELARELPPATLRSITAALELGAGGANEADVVRLANTQAARDKLTELLDAQGSTSTLSRAALGFALRVASNIATIEAAQRHVEIAWTGSAAGAVATRRVDQVFYDLVESAQSELFVVTYAAYGANRALELLGRASGRGVAVTLVIELAKESGGKISFDGREQIRAIVPNAKILYWPLSRRPSNDAGSHGTMHAKCLISDRRRALVSSANLTEYALESNMELGLLVEGVTAERVAAHFDQLIAQEDLVAVS